MGGGSSFNHPLIFWPSLLAAILITWQVIWKRGLVPAYHFIRKITIMVDRINDEFSPNGGDSLRDAVDHKASKEDLSKIEEGVLEAIRIGRENGDNLERYAVHLREIPWHQERLGVMHRITVLEERQEAMRVAVMDALKPVAGADGAFGSLVQQVITALEHLPSAEKTD